MRVFHLSIIVIAVIILSCSSGHKKNEIKSISVSEGKKLRIAVLDLKSDGVPISQSRKISELIRTEMISTNNYIVIERSQMDMLLREQGFQQTGCTDESCAVEVGKLLSTQKILIGTVMKLGNSIIITGRIVDVQKGIAEIGAKEAASSEDDLLNAISLFSQKLTGDASNKSVATSTSTTSAAVVKTEKKVYASYESIVVQFFNLPGSRYDWIAISKSSAPNNSFESYYYTSSKKEGSLTFNGLPSGDYEVRAYLNWGKGKYDINAKYSFKVK